MFRRRFQANGGGLPSTASPVGGRSSSSLFGVLSPQQQSTNQLPDGSARSIHLPSPIMTKWKRSSRAVKNAYITAFVCFFIVLAAWRSLSYDYANIRLDCTSMACSLAIRAMGSSTIRLDGIPRQQIVGAKPIKVNAAGVVVNHDVNLNASDEWLLQHETEKSNDKKDKKNNKKKQHYEQKKSNNYKGPDKDGNYLTYAILLNHKGPQPTTESDKPGAADPSQEDGSIPPPLPYVDLSPVLPFLVQASAPDSDPNHYYLIARQQGLEQAKRRVRTYVQKLDAYVKRRRHKFLIKESKPPDWKAVLVLVIGGCVFIVSILLGMFWEDDEMILQQAAAHARGPGVRRPHHHHQQQPKRPVSKASSSSTSSNNPYQQAIPSRYEVSTTTKKIGSSSSTVRRKM